MRQVAIHRQLEDVDNNTPGSFKTFIYPFDTFPVIVSHVHPCFVICDSGQKLQDYENIVAFQKGDTELGETLGKVAELYYHWTKPHGSYAGSIY